MALSAGNYGHTTQKMKFSIKDFFSKCDQIRRKEEIGRPLWRTSFFSAMSVRNSGGNLVSPSKVRLRNLVQKIILPQ